ncbi:MAG: response regulator [Lachnospiraceae bacterium]|nr:response regulator [Lachnospiraceae bacterium]
MHDRILIIDDDKINRRILIDILASNYTIMEASDGKEGLEILRSNKEKVALVLLEVNVPEIDGIEIIKTMKAEKMLSHTPVIIISAENIAEIEEKCLELGCTDYIRKPFRQAVVKRRVENVLSSHVYRTQLEEQVALQTEKLVEQYEKIKLHSSILEQMNEELIDVLGTIVEYRSLESGDHIQSVKRYTKILGRYIMEEFPEYNLTKKDLKIIVAASALHDVGKVAISDTILFKPGKLTDEEFEEIKTHSDKGSKIVDRMKNIWSKEYAKYCYEICRYHHEKYDGKGYPDGLKGEEIPIAAQLVSMADVYDALTNVRCYKNAYTVYEAYDMIMNGECGEFSPKLLEALEHTRAELEEAVHLHLEK